MYSKLSRRSWLQAAGFGSLVTGVAAWSRAVLGQGTTPDGEHAAHSGHAHVAGTVGRVDPATFDPTRFVRSWNFNALPPDEQRRFYRETPRPDGSLLREYDLYAVDREIEIAPGREVSRRGPTTDKCPVRRSARPKAIGCGCAS